MGNFLGDLWDAGKRKVADVSSDVRTGLGVISNVLETGGKTLSTGIEIGGGAVDAVLGTAYDAGDWLLSPVIDGADHAVSGMANFAGYVSASALAGAADMGNTFVGFWSDSEPFGDGTYLAELQTEFAGGVHSNLAGLMDAGASGWTDDGWDEVQAKTRTRIDNFMNATDSELLEYKDFVDAQWESAAMMMAANAEADRRLGMGEDPSAVDDDFREAYAMAQAMSPDLTADDWANLTFMVAVMYVDKAGVTPFKKQVFKLLDNADLPNVIKFTDDVTGVTAVLPDTPAARAALAMLDTERQSDGPLGNLVGDFEGAQLGVEVPGISGIMDKAIDLTGLDKLKDLGGDWGVAGYKAADTGLGNLDPILSFRDAEDQRKYNAMMLDRYQENRASTESKRWKDNRSRQGPTY